MKRSTATMNYIPTHLIDPNPHRDFTINPIRVDNIETLVGSFQRNTQMDALVVRKHPTEPGRYQLSAGHHRLFAMGGLKGTPTAGPAPEVLDLPEVRVLIKDMTDDQMLTWMADENANQSGATPSNDMDSVKGVVTRIAYLMISGADEPEWVSSGIPEKTSDTGGAPPWSRACAEFNSGKGIGSPLILRFPGMQSLKKTRIESALASLKAMQEHGYADAISTAQALYQADLDAEYEAEQIRIRDAEEAKKRAQEAKRKAEADRKKAEADLAQAQAAKDRKRAEAAKKLKEKAEQEERERHAREQQRIKEEKERRERAQQKAIEDEERAARALETAKRAQAEAATKGLHPSIPPRFSTVDHMDTFRGMVASGKKRANGKPYFTAEDQPALLDRIIANAPKKGGEPHLTSDYIRAFISGEIAKQDAVDRNQSEQERRALEQRTKSERATRLVDDVQRAVGTLGTALQAVEKAAQADPEVRAFLEDELRRTRLANYMDVTQNALNRMREVFPIKRRDGGPAEVLING